MFNLGNKENVLISIHSPGIGDREMSYAVKLLYQLSIFGFR